MEHLGHFHKCEGIGRHGWLEESTIVCHGLSLKAGQMIIADGETSYTKRRG